MPDDLLHDEGKKFFGKIRIELGLLGKRAQAFDLLGLARGIGRRQPMLRLESAYRLGAFETLGEKMDQGRIDIVDRIPQALQFRFNHAFELSRFRPKLGRA